jgi:trehalose utilization protein
VKANQSGLMGEMARFFDDPGTICVTSATTLDKGHGRTEERSASVSAGIGWLDGGRRFPGEHRFAKLALIARVSSAVWEKGK